MKPIAIGNAALRSFFAAAFDDYRGTMQAAHAKSRMYRAAFRLSLTIAYVVPVLAGLVYIEPSRLLISAAYLGAAQTAYAVHALRKRPWRPFYEGITFLDFLGVALVLWAVGDIAFPVWAFHILILFGALGRRRQYGLLLAATAIFVQLATAGALTYTGDEVSWGWLTFTLLTIAFGGVNIILLGDMDDSLRQPTEYMARRDGLTGLFNHREAHILFRRLIAEAQSSGRPLSVLLADIDGFKLFNDTYGHSRGDEVLRIVAHALGEVDGDAVLCRYGGDEFLIFLKGADRRRAGEFAAGTRARLSESAFIVDDRRIPIGLSIGSATFPDDGVRVQELLARADVALYAAKKQGANTERVAGELPTSQDTSFGVLDALIRSVDLKDQYTKAHCDVVADYAARLAAEVGLSGEVQRALHMAGLLHDVGKIVVPDEILKKPGALTPEEYDVMKRHVSIGEVLIRELPRMKDVAQAVACHHERFDGKGYPRGLRGDDIPLIGRIISIADAFSAMSLDRPYRKALPPHEVVKQLADGAGSQFDPDLVDVFLSIIREDADLVA